MPLNLFGAFKSYVLNQCARFYIFFNLKILVTMKINVLMTIAIAVVTSLTVNAQLQRMQPYSGRSPAEVRQVYPREEFTLPGENLNDQQHEEIRKIRTEQLKERTKTGNLLKEKRAKLESLQTANQPDIKEINKVIDEIAAIQAQEMKAQAVSRQRIRSLLTDEQRAAFDSRGAYRKNMCPDSRGIRPNDRQVRHKDRQFRPRNERLRGMSTE